MNTEGASQIRIVHTPPCEPEKSTGAPVMESHGTNTSPEITPFAGMRTRRLTLVDIERLPDTLAEIDRSNLQGLEIEERVIETEDSHPSHLVRTGSESSIGSSDSSDSAVSGISFASSEGSDIAPYEVKSGKELLKIPDAPDFFVPPDRANLLANLIMGRIPHDQKMAIPVETLEMFCMQAIADLQYLTELGMKIKDNIELLDLPKTAFNAITSKLEQTREPYNFLKEDLNSCVMQFKKGEYKTVSREIVPRSMDNPRGPCRLVTVTTDYVDKLICTWIYVLRNQEEWRKAMPAPEQIVKVELPDVMVGNPKKDSAVKLTRQLQTHSESMTRCWRELEAKVKPTAKKQPVRRGGGSLGATPTTAATPVKRLPALIPAPLSDEPGNATFTIESHQLPVAFDFGKSVELEDSTEFSDWVLPHKKEFETRTEQEFASREAADLALEDIQDGDRDETEIYGEHRPGAGVSPQYYAPLRTRPVNYFDYQPVAINALEKLVEIGQNNTRKVLNPAMMLAGDKFAGDRLNKRQREYWKEMRQDLNENSCKLWSLRIPSLQQAVNVICAEKHRLEVERVRKEKKKKESSLMHKLEVGFYQVQEGLRSPRRTSNPTPGVSPCASPVPGRRIMHTQSEPALLPDPQSESARVPPVRSRSIAALSHADLMLRLQFEKRKRDRKESELSEATGLVAPEIVVETDITEASGFRFPKATLAVPDLRGLSPIPSEPGSLTPDDIQTPKGQGSSPESPQHGSSTEDLQTPMLDVRDNPFSAAFQRKTEEDS